MRLVVVAFCTSGALEVDFVVFFVVDFTPGSVTVGWSLAFVPAMDCFCVVSITALSVVDKWTISYRCRDKSTFLDVYL